MVTWTGTIYCVQREVFHLYLLVLVLDFLFLFLFLFYLPFIFFLVHGEWGGGGERGG